MWIAGVLGFCDEAPGEERKQETPVSVTLEKMQESIAKIAAKIDVLVPDKMMTAV